MKISWLGQSCFKIQSQDGVTLVTDPFDSKLGIKMPKVGAHIVTVSHDHYDHNNKDTIKKIDDTDPFFVDSPGEHEIRNVFIQGVPAYHDKDNKEANIIYLIRMDGIVIVHLGDLGQKKLTPAQLEIIEGADILLIPVGGKTTINGEEAVDVINDIEPRIVIPMHYNIKGVKEPLDKIDKFCSEMGVCSTDVIPVLKILKKDLPQEETKVYVMSIE